MALVWLLSNCYQKASPNAANPHKHWGFTEVRFIPTLLFRGFTCYITDYSVDMFNFVDDAVGDSA